MIPLQSNASADLIIAPTLCGSVIPSKARIIGFEEFFLEISINLSKDIVLDDVYTLRMKYPSLTEFIKNNFGALEDMNVDDTFELIASCIDQVYSEEESWASEECTKKELITFIESLNSSQFKKVEKFFETMPKLSHTVTVTNPNTQVESDIKIEGLQNFFG